MITGYLSVDKTLHVKEDNSVPNSWKTCRVVNFPDAWQIAEITSYFSKFVLQFQVFLNTSRLKYREQCIFKAQEFIMQKWYRRRRRYRLPFSLIILFYLPSISTVEYQTKILTTFRLNISYKSFEIIQ